MKGIMFVAKVFWLANILSSHVMKSICADMESGAQGPLHREREREREREEANQIRLDQNRVERETNWIRYVKKEKEKEETNISS